MEIITNNQLLHKGTRAATIKGNYNYIQLINTRAMDKKSKYKVKHVEQLHGKNDNNSIKTLPLIY